MPTVLLGRVNILVTALKLDKSVPQETAIQIYNSMAAVGDPKLAEITETYQLAWVEVPHTSEVSRNLVLQQFLGFMTKLPKDGSRIVPEGTQPVQPPPEPTRESRIVGLNGKRFLLPEKEEGDQTPT